MSSENSHNLTRFPTHRIVLEHMGTLKTEGTPGIATWGTLGKLRIKSYSDRGSPSPHRHRFVIYARQIKIICVGVWRISIPLICAGGGGGGGGGVPRVFITSTSRISVTRPLLLYVLWPMSERFFSSLVLT